MIHPFCKWHVFLLSSLAAPRLLGVGICFKEKIQILFYERSKKMAKAKLSPVFDEVRGAYGDLVFKEVKGITVWAHKPVQTDGLNAAQTAFKTRCLRANE
jgi:hypothetical protein